MIPQKKLLLAVLMIIVAISLAGWIVLLRGFKTEPNSNTNAANTNISNINTAPNDNVNEQQLNVNNQPIDTSDWQTYRNEELGFEMKIPPSWKDYRVETRPSPNNIIIFDIVDFSLPLKTPMKLDSGGELTYGSELAIAIYSQKEWDKELAFDQPHPTFIIKNSEKVSTYGIANGDWNLRDMTDEQAKRDALEIVKTFHILNP